MSPMASPQTITIISNARLLSKPETVPPIPSLPKYAVGLFDSKSGPGPRKRKRLTHLTPEEKIMRRKLKNRVAAQTARDRKKLRLESLEETIHKVQKQARELLNVNMQLLSRAETLENENRMMRKRLGMSSNQDDVVASKKLHLEQIKTEFDETLNAVHEEHPSDITMSIPDSILSPDESSADESETHQMLHLKPGSPGSIICDDDDDDKEALKLRLTCSSNDVLWEECASPVPAAGCCISRDSVDPLFLQDVFEAASSDKFSGIFFSDLKQQTKTEPANQSKDRDDLFGFLYQISTDVNRESTSINAVGPETSENQRSASLIPDIGHSSLTTARVVWPAVVNTSTTTDHIINSTASPLKTTSLTPKPVMKVQLSSRSTKLIKQTSSSMTSPSSAVIKVDINSPQKSAALNVDRVLKQALKKRSANDKKQSSGSDSGQQFVTSQQDDAVLLLGEDAKPPMLCGDVVKHDDFDVFRVFTPETRDPFEAEIENLLRSDFDDSYSLCGSSPAFSPAVSDSCSFGSDAASGAGRDEYNLCFGDSMPDELLFPQLA